MMHCLFQCITLIWIVKFVAVATSPDSIFSIMPLDSSGLLITWDPNNFTEDLADEMKIAAFRFEYVIRGQENIIQSSVTVRRIENGQVMLNRLLENTTYRITIMKLFISRSFEFPFKSRETKERYVIEGKTGRKIKSPPAKPDFSFDYIHKQYLTMSIMWLPCGQEKNCQGLVAGSYFRATYKCLETGKVFTQCEFLADTIYINFLLPGRAYLVTVTSINDYFQTDSDPREIFIEPFCGPVQSVELTSVNTPNNSSVIISWKPPQSMDEAVHSYGVCFYSLNPSNFSWDELSWRNKLMVSKCQVTYADKSTKLYHLAIDISALPSQHQATEFRFLIIPYADNFYSRYGLVYELDYRTS